MGSQMAVKQKLKDFNPPLASNEMAMEIYGKTSEIIGIMSLQISCTLIKSHAGILISV